MFSEYLSKNQISYDQPGAAKIYKRQIVKELKSAIESNGRKNEKKIEERKNLMKYWQASKK